MSIVFLLAFQSSTFLIILRKLIFDGNRESSDAPAWLNKSERGSARRHGFPKITEHDVLDSDEQNLMPSFLKGYDRSTNSWSTWVISLRKVPLPAACFVSRKVEIVEVPIRWTV